MEHFLPQSHGMDSSDVLLGTALGLGMTGVGISLVGSFVAEGDSTGGLVLALALVSTTPSLQRQLRHFGKMFVKPRLQGEEQS